MSRFRSRTCVIAAALFVLMGCRGANAGPAEPLLELDTGGHLGMVRGLLYTPDGREIVTAGDDKTIRVWDASTGKLRHTIRGEMDFGEPGKILTIAMSPDGKLLAAAGNLPFEGQRVIRLYDFPSGRIVHLFKGHTDVVISVAFSPDGKRLASGGADDVANIWDVKSRKLLARMEKAHEGDVNIVRFSNDSARLFTGGDDNLVKLWSLPDGKPIAQLEGHTDKVVSLAVNPRKGVVASGGLDGAILLWNGETGASIGALSTSGPEVMGLAYSQDGGQLISGSGRRPFEILVRSIPDGEVRARYRGHDGLVMAVAIDPSGKIAATSGGNDNELHLWSIADAKALRVVRGIGGAIWSVGFSADGTLLGWGKEKPAPGARGALAAALRLPKADTALGEPRALPGETRMIRASEKRGGIELKKRSSGEFGYEDLLDIFEDGQVRATIKRGQDDGYVHNAFTIAPNKETIVSGGGHGRLDAYDLDGRKLRSFVGHTSDVWSVAISPNGELLASGGDDQTVRLWNLATGENIATLLAGRDGAWVIWTDEGYYAASPSGDGHVGWRLNGGEGQPARFITAAQLKRHFYRPDIVTRALVLGDARRAAAETGGNKFDLAELIRRQPLEFTITSPQEGDRVLAGDMTIRLRIAPNLDPVESFDVTIGAVRAASRVSGRVISSDANGEVRELVVLIPQEGAVLEVRAANAVGQTVRKVALNRPAVSVERRGTLFLVSVGVDNYSFFDQDLRFAGADARSIIDAMQKSGGSGYSRILRLLLVEKGDETPLAVNVDASLDALRQAGPDDTVVLFLAGHGVNDGADYLFLPSDARFDKGKWQSKTVVKWEALQELIEKSRGRRIMLVDTCHAGNAFNPRLIKDAADASIVVVAATDAETLALERPELGHGVFTHALLEALGGKADANTDRKITVRELITYVTDLVFELTGGRQRPTSHAPDLSIVVAEY